MRNRSGILVGVDGSTFSDAAVRWAALDAASHNEDLTLMTALQRDDLSVRNEQLRPPPAPPPPSSTPPRCWPAPKRSPRPPSARDDCRSIRTEFVFASPVPALVAESKKARMLVVGCRGNGRTGPTHARIGQ